MLLLEEDHSNFELMARSRLMFSLVFCMVLEVRINTIPSSSFVFSLRLLEENSLYPFNKFEQPALQHQIHPRPACPNPSNLWHDL
jgi:hypothetical protein